MVVLQPFQTPSRSKTGLSQIFSISIPPSSRKCKRITESHTLLTPTTSKEGSMTGVTGVLSLWWPSHQQMGEGSRWVHDLPILNFLDILSGGKNPLALSTSLRSILISWKSHLAMSFLDIQCCLLGLTFCMNISQLASRNCVGSATNVLTGALWEVYGLHEPSWTVFFSVFSCFFYASRTTRNPGREVKMNNAAAKCLVSSYGNWARESYTPGWKLMAQLPCTWFIEDPY